MTKPAPKQKQQIDLLSPPLMMAGGYLLLFGVGILDILYFDDRSRLRMTILFYRGLSWEANVYLALTYVFFVVGYYLTPAGAITRSLKPAQRQWLPQRTTLVTTTFFLATFAVLMLYTLQIGYGRYGGGGGETFANLVLLGELSFIPYAFSLVRYVQAKASVAQVAMSQFDRFFLWWVMLPAQLGFSIFIGIRSRAVVVVLMALTAFHYGYKRLELKWFAILGIAILFLAVPLLERLRLDPRAQLLLPQESSSFSVRAWQSIAGRTSAIETFTVIYENTAIVPEPDPIHWALITGLVPRFLWPGKPVYTFNERLTLWAVGVRDLSWMGPTLPGELLLMLGSAGALAFMGFLGALWRVIKDICRVDEKGGVWIVLYVVLIRAVMTIEVGFVIPYATLLRYLLATVLLILVTTVPIRERVPQIRPTLAGGRRFPDPSPSPG